MKEMLTNEQLVEHMKNKGIKFTIVSEEDAKEFLKNNNYYMTNDTHQLVFVFRASGGGFDTKHYSYGPVYFIVCLWELGCAAVTFALIGVKCRGSAARRRIVLPLIPMALLIVYGVLYVLRALPPIYINDITVMTAVIETANGYLGVDGNYRELFFWGTDGSFLGKAEASDLFGASYPWMSDAVPDADGHILICMTQERTDESCDEVLMFRLTGF